MDLGRISHALSVAFDGNRPTFVTDSPVVNDALRASGALSYLYEDIPTVAEEQLLDVVAVPVDFARTPPGSFIERYFDHAAMLVLPIASFCATPTGALYMLEMLSGIDLRRSVAGVQFWLEQLESAASLRLTGHGTDITVELGDEVCLMAPKGVVRLARGEWASIAQYLEVGLITKPEIQRPAHEMNGVFCAEGVVVAHHRHYWRQVKSTSDEIWRYLRNLRERNDYAPILVEVVDSRPMSLTCGDESVLHEVRKFVDPDNREFVTEFGFASAAQWSLRNVDWSINSQLNEAIGGLHIGLGRGVTGAHIDLVAPRVELVPSGVASS